MLLTNEMPGPEHPLGLGTPERLEIMSATRLPTPEELQELFPLTDAALEKVTSTRLDLRRIFNGLDPRLVVIIGPCSLDDSGAVFEFVEEISAFTRRNGLDDKLQIIFRAPPSKPRTEGGWHGLEQDSVALSRKILAELVNRGYPVGLEAVQPAHFARYGDLASLLWVGARTASDSALRLSASVYDDVPVLFKNAEDGSVKPAIQAMNVAGGQHENAHFIGPDGSTWSIPKSRGNEPAAIILRGGKSGHNIKPEVVLEAVEHMAERGIHNHGVVIDVAHQNSAAFNPPEDKKSANGQLPALREVLKLIKNTQTRPYIRGVMIEAYSGVSLTDPTVDLETAKNMLKELAKSL